MSDTAGDFFPRGLLLGAEEFGGIFEDEDVAVVDAVEAGAGFEERDGDKKIHLGTGVAIAVADDGHLHFAGSRAHAMAAAEEVVEGFHGFGGKDGFDGGADEGGLAAGVEHLGEGAVGEDDAAAGVEGGDAVGDGFEHGFELAAAGFEGGVGFGELDVGGFDGMATVLEIGGHVVEAANEFAEFFGGAFGDAVAVVSGGDCFHCVGERFDGLGDLLGEMEREPCGGEEREASHHQEEQHI